MTYYFTNREDELTASIQTALAALVFPEEQQVDPGKPVCYFYNGANHFEFSPAQYKGVAVEKNMCQLVRLKEKRGKQDLEEEVELDASAGWANNPTLEGAAHIPS